MKYKCDTLFQVGKVTSVRLTLTAVPTLTVSWVWIVWTSLLQEWGQCVVHALRDIVEMGQSAPVSYSNNNYMLITLTIK